MSPPFSASRPVFFGGMPSRALLPSTQRGRRGVVATPLPSLVESQKHESLCSQRSRLSQNRLVCKRATLTRFDVNAAGVSDKLLLISRSPSVECSEIDDFGPAPWAASKEVPRLHCKRRRKGPVGPMKRYVPVSGAILSSRRLISGGRRQKLPLTASDSSSSQFGHAHALSAPYLLT